MMNFHPVLAAWNVDFLCYLTIAASVILGFRFRHSFFALPFVVAISLLAEDTFYPLSHFPMYSDPDESENYLFIGTWEKDTESPVYEEITPLPVRQITGVTAPKVKKLQKAWIRSRADELDVKDTEMDEAEKVKEWLKILDYLRERVRKGQELPEKLALVEVWIEFDKEKGYRETGRVVASQMEASK